jgi:hypothetical protein
MNLFLVNKSYFRTAFCERSRRSSARYTSTCDENFLLTQI